MVIVERVLPESLSIDELRARDHDLETALAAQQIRTMQCYVSSDRMRLISVYEAQGQDVVQRCFDEVEGAGYERIYQARALREVGLP